MKTSVIVNSMNPEMDHLLQRLQMYIYSRNISYPRPTEAQKAIFAEYLASARKLRNVLREEIKCEVENENNN